MAADDAVIVALREQVVCYRKLSKLAELQHDYVQKGNTEGLLQVLQSRQQLLDAITTLEQTVGPAKKDWSSYLQRLDGASRAEAESAMNQTRALLEQITTADREDALVLQQQKMNIGKQINRNDSARQINRMYAAAAYGKPKPKMDVRS